MTKAFPPSVFYANYVETYVQRDVRSLKNIGNLGLFDKFLRLCAGRIGQILNVSSLANDAGISATTATRWLSVLEQSYIVHRLGPDCKSFAKRVTKSPKLYFVDTGLACYLLGTRKHEQLEYHHLRGNLFENLVLNRFRLSKLNSGESADFTFWRDKNGLEIDLLVNFVSSDGRPLTNAWEIKSGETPSLSYFDNLAKWAPLIGDQLRKKGVIYAGGEDRHTAKGELIDCRGLDIESLQAEA